MSSNRRSFLSGLGALAFLFLRPGRAFSLATERDRADGSIFPYKGIDFFLNETLNYDMGFLWFSKAAEGNLKFTREGDDRYRAELVAETKGFVGFVTSYRKHVYISHFKYLPDKGKLRTFKFERKVIIRKREEKTVTTLDYETRAMSWKDYKGGKLTEERSEPILEGADYEDIISAFYNFRMGVFGPIKRDRRFKIHTMPEKGQTMIEVNITSKEDAFRDRSLFGEGFDEELIYIKVKVPKEIFKSKSGEVSLWIGDKITPIRAVVKDYIGFGDVSATKREGA